MHADVYRLDTLGEIADLGLPEMIEDGAVAFVEWGDVAVELLGTEWLVGALRDRRRRPPPDHPRRFRPVVVGPVAGDRRRVGGPAARESARPVNLLAIESATDAVGVALLRDGAGTAVVLHEGGRAHAELLVPSIDEVCRSAALEVSDLDVIAVDVGPGLFTGLRVGVATAKALGQALSIGVVPVTSLDVLATAAIERLEEDRVKAVVAVVDARRGEVFVALYRIEGAAGAELGAPPDPAPVREDFPHPVDPETLAERVGALASAGRVVVVGDGALRYRDLLAARPDVDLALADELRVPPPAVLARLAAGRLSFGERPEAPDAVRPDYRREADARINWEERSPRPEPAGSPDRRRA